MMDELDWRHLLDDDIGQSPADAAVDIEGIRRAASRRTRFLAWALSLGGR